jgi:hypothetical protein
MADADFTQLSIKLIYIYGCSVDRMRYLFFFSGWLRRHNTSFVGDVKDKTLGSGGLMFVARRGSDRKDHDALEAAFGRFEVLTGFADSFLCCESERTSDGVAVDNICFLPAGKEFRHNAQVWLNLSQGTESIPKICALRRSQKFLGESVEIRQPVAFPREHLPYTRNIADVSTNTQCVREWT